MQTLKKRLIKKVPVLFTIVDNMRHLFRKVAMNRQITSFRRSDAGPAVCYLTEQFPRRPSTRKEYAHGGAVKMTYLAENFPHKFPSANILYAVSSVGHPFRSEIVHAAKDRGVKIVVNQNGVAYPAWHGEGWEKTNRELKALLDQADYILYQSHFCQVGAEHFICPPDVPREILFNPVDTDLFQPVSASSKPHETTLILGGNQYERYRFELAVETLGMLIKNMPQTKLIITGKLWTVGDGTFEWAERYITNLGIKDKVEFTGTYVQEEAPSIFARGHILLHTKFNDPSPTVVLEALSSGIPVVYLHSGGTPELVGEAGIGVPMTASWEKAELPAPHLLSEAVIKVMDDYSHYAEIARQRALDVFSLDKFIQAHQRVFETMLMS